MTTIWRLNIEDDEGQVTPLDLGLQRYTVGRDAGCDIRLTERNVSRHHAVFQLTNQGWQISDQKSNNGTFVNGERIDASGALLSAGDVVNVGDYRLELIDAVAQQAAAQEELNKQRRPDRLVVVIGPAPGVEYPLHGERLVVGRAEEASLSINHASVSRFHAELVNLGQNRWEVIDQSSSNGVRINGVDLRRGIIEPGDALELGDVRLRFVAAGKFFRPVVDLSHQLPALEGMTTGPSSAAATPKSIFGRVVAFLALVVVVGGGIYYSLVNAPAVEKDTPVAQTDQQAEEYLTRALKLIEDGEFGAAHRLLRKIPEDSAIRDDARYRQVEDGWADWMFQRADKAEEADDKRKLLEEVADTTTVSVDKRKEANNRLVKLGFEARADPVAPAETRRPANPTLRPPFPNKDDKGEGDNVFDEIDGDRSSPDPDTTQVKGNTPSPPRPKVIEPEFKGSSQKQRLLNKARTGNASMGELRQLKGICMTDGDAQCRSLANAQMRQLKKEKDE